MIFKATDIIPPPVKIDNNPDIMVDWHAFGIKKVAGLPSETFGVVQNDFPGLLNIKKANAFFVRFTKTETTSISSVEVPQKADAYVLRITPEGIAIDANDRFGLWHGLQTLTQMINGQNTIPSCEIHDHAAIRRRGIHWDLKGYLPKFSVLLNEFRRLARYKINLILLEIEDKYQYKSAPGIGCPGAYTFEQLRTLSKYAAALGITVVPKLQCLGHVDYILKLPQYRKLREGKHPYQYCPRSEDAFTLWKAMAEELMECFDEHREFFHIGADETDKLGVCPKCAKHSKADSYIYHVNRCLDFIIERNRTPVMWDDVIRNAHGLLNPDEAEQLWVLGKKAILNYWAYGYGGKRNIFPFMAAYNKQKANIWGACGFSGCEKWDGSLPPLEFRAKNIDAWTKSTIENNLEALIATGWTRIASATPPTEPHETSWFTILYAAESMWTGTPHDCNDFIDALSQQLYGRYLPAPLRLAVLNISRNPFSLHDINPELDNDPLSALLQYAAASESFADCFNEITASRKMFQGRIGIEMADYIIEGRRRVLLKFQNDLAELEKRVRKYLGEFYEAATVNEYILTRFEYCHEYAKEFLQLLDAGRLL